MRLVVLCPHFAPDTAPTGDVMTQIVAELVKFNIEVHVVTALPWYRNHEIESGWTGRLIRRERTPWGSITHVHPFPGKNKQGLLRRAFGFIAFSMLAGISALFAGGIHRRVHAVFAMSPPLTLGLTGWCASVIRRAPLIFNIQDVFPDAAVATGAITNPVVIAFAKKLETVSYHRARKVVVLSQDLQRNVQAKMKIAARNRVVVIPNFVDADAIRPLDRMTAYRKELSIGAEPVVMYAGNVGFSQSLELLIEAARQMPHVTFVINGGGSAKDALQVQAIGLSNIRFGQYQPHQRLPEVLASADIHVVPLHAGLGAVSVPSKTYSILAAGRAIVAAIDLDTEVPRILADSGGGLCVAPDDAPAFIGALTRLVDDPAVAQSMGKSGREWAESHVSAEAVAKMYVELLSMVTNRLVASFLHG
ncbi:MAG: glycosyltransferase WbuB [Ilumatobacteraceae bacterium]|nr:glycosyltransferase WbuB [Ilumatobacteraceae bacterium]